MTANGGLRTVKRSKRLFRGLPASRLYRHSGQIQAGPTAQVHGPDLKNNTFPILDPRDFCPLEDPGLRIGCIVSTDDIGRATQIRGGANEIDCCRPNSPDVRGAYTETVSLALVE